MTMQVKELVSENVQKETALLAAQSMEHINDAIAAYKADLRRRGASHMFNVLSDISASWIEQVAYETTRAKTALRSIFRNVKECGEWNEKTQRLCVSATTTRNPDRGRIIELFQKITAPYRLKLTTPEEVALLAQAGSFFTGFQDDISCQAAVDTLAPGARRNGRKLSKIFNDFAKAIGVFSDVQVSRDKPEHVTSYPYLFAQLADELNGRKLAFKVYLSLNPADFVTASNPYTGMRSDTCISCHSLNRSDFSYSAGNVGYARDAVTFIVFTVADDDNPETFYTRKVTRQFFMYLAGNGVLLQSKLYPNGNDVETQALYRDLVQRAISEGEATVNLWATHALARKTDFGLIFHAAKGFGGYADWLEQPSFGHISLSKVAREHGYRDFGIGAPGLCVFCGAETYGAWHYCEAHDDSEMCPHCGRRRHNEDDGEWVVTPDGLEEWVCSSCLEAYYFFCEDCNRWHHESDMYRLGDDKWVCKECRDENYVQCGECGEWCYRSDATGVDIYGSAEVVCQSCLDEYYYQCAECGNFFREDTMNEAVAATDTNVHVCNACLDNYYRQCDRCNRYVHETRFNPTDTGGYCEACRDYVQMEDNE